MTDRPQSTNKVARWGAIHIHTDYSDGRVSFDDTVSAAQRSGLDFIAVTDHNTLEPRRHEGYHEDLLVQVDVEITPTSFGDHLLAFGLPDYDDLHELPREEFVRAVTAAGGFGWVPHPCGFYYPWLGIWNSKWRDWGRHIGGLDLSTYLVEWVGRLRPWNAWKLLRGASMPVFEPSPAVLKLWDHLNAQRPTVGFIGIDAHHRSRLGGWLHSPPYDVLFGTHNVLAWTPPPSGDAVADLRDLREALREGHFVNVFANVGGRAEFRFERRGDRIEVVVPEVAGREDIEVRVLRDGAEVIRGSDREVGVDASRPGVYRAEIRRGGALWALTNAIRVRTGPSDAQDLPADHQESVARSSPDR